MRMLVYGLKASHGMGCLRIIVNDATSQITNKSRSLTLKQSPQEFQNLTTSLEFCIP